MAETKPKADAPVSKDAPHDRVVSLSLKSDGTPDQNNPEIIGDKDAALAATKRQFAEFAVSAADHKLRVDAGLASDDEGSTADAKIDALKAEHDKVAKAAEAKAESVVNSLHQG